MEALLMLGAVCSTGSARLASGASVAVAPTTRLVRFFYSATLQDHLVAGTDAAVAAAKGSYRDQTVAADAAHVFVDAATPPTGAVALKTYYSAALGDSLTTARVVDAALPGVDGNYSLVRTEGYCYPTGGLSRGVAWLQYWNAALNDSFLVPQGSSHERAAMVAGYVSTGVECYSAALWVKWPSEPPADCPFPPSKDLLGWEYLSAANANYGGADTWYPSWGADGNLYTPWTDGTVEGVRAGSGGNRAGGFRSTTGQAVVTGSDPFHLNVTAVKTFASSVWPYLGRYPCGSLHYNGTWWYGTYYLLNPNTTVQFPDGTSHFSGPNPGPNCGNWCVQGPLVDFRFSTDNGATWHEPRPNSSGLRDNLFGESAFDNGKVKFGAPHFVDFGKNLEHSPDGKAYIVGHGATNPGNVQAWMLGDEVYLARVEPTVEAIGNGSQWEFWAGAGGWVQGDVSSAKPIAAWNRRMGVVTMTYFAPLRKYVMTVSTATKYPSMVGPFDTYFLESDQITGPWSLVSYNAQFGPEAYFVNFPSKFLAAELSGNAFHGFLSYSANFAFHHTANPPGSGYHWSLQQMRILVGGQPATGRL
eukprot:TRINITY_DN11028_c0_g1_i1.p1 TRINITY_DN11028_c0_g1~~TRINITY_DN11028_c0_g1_i1.p1  ORF type:complete len:586 (+),score=99.03 TRINITY_DN11028_c0_g1_i1:71-1828(+)